MSELVIDVKKLNKQFEGKSAVRDFKLTLKRGEICGFLGPNGSGKTTTLRMLCGLLTPDSGEGVCLGYDILTQSYQIKRQVGYMTQRFSLYHEMTVYENLVFIASIYQIKNQADVISYYLNRFNLTANKSQLAGTLSGGMQQRLALAGCLLHQPQLLLLDEPTAGVDPKTRREFWDEIHHLAQEGITTLVSTHYMDEALRCTRLVYLAYGSLLAIGTPHELIQHSNLSTWLVAGARLAELAEQLRQIAYPIQVAFFGDKLHVSGSDEVILKEIMQPYQKEYNWQKIEPDLEDVFIDLVKQAEKGENYYE